MPYRWIEFIFGFQQSVNIEALRARLDGNQVADLHQVWRTVRSRLRAGAAGPGDSVLTDDRTPIEPLTDQMMKRQRTGEGLSEERGS